MIQTFLTPLKTYSQILICPAHQIQYLDFIYFLKGDDFPLLAMFFVCGILLGIPEESELSPCTLHLWSLGGKHAQWFQLNLVMFTEVHAPAASKTHLQRYYSEACSQYGEMKLI